MTDISERILAFVIDLESDETLNLNVDHEYDVKNDFFHITHDCKNNDFDEETADIIVTKMLKHLDSKGIFNYSFGYSQELENKYKIPKVTKSIGVEKDYYYLNKGYSKSIVTSKTSLPIAV